MQHILVVDDNRLNLQLAKDALKDHYQVSIILSGIAALDFLKENPVDLILLDIEMPKLNGIDTLLHMKQDDMISNIPVIFLTALSNPEIEAKCLTLGAQDFITKPFFKPAMLQRVQRVLELESLRSNLEQQVLQKTKELEMLTIQTITTFANAIDAKDPYTKGHSFRVAQYSKLIAQKLKWSELALRNLFYTALLHDIGKIGIPDYILTKTSTLNPEEFSAIQKHPEIGCHILEDVILVPYLGIGALNHHERMDGSGYPFGKKGDNIPLIGRIISVADAVDAMTSDRAYRKKLSLDQVISELETHAGTQFDSTIATIMIGILQSGITLPSEKTMLGNQNVLLSKIVNEYINISNIDGLTGLWNRIHLEEQMHHYLQNPDAEGALLMIDLDNFKQINDVWGHTAGDSLLANVSVTIQTMLIDGGIACRMGGDEFAIFMPGISESAATKFAHDLSEAIRNYMKRSNSPFQVTLSIGIALFPVDGSTYHDLYHNADKALYYAKHTAKDKFALYSDVNTQSLILNFGNDIVNLSNLKDYLSEKSPKKGAYLVHQNEFKKIYQLLQRMATRSQEKQQIILFTFSHQDKIFPADFDLSTKIKYLISATKESLRLGDVFTRLGEYQYVVLVKNASPDVAEMVAQRILEHYYKLDFHSSLDLIYEIDEYADI